MPIAAIDQHSIRGTFVHTGRTGFALTDPLIDLRSGHVIHIKKIGVTIRVEVRDHTTDRPIGHGDSRGFGHIGECAIAIVPQQLIAADIGDIEVGKAVVVEVSDRGSLTKPAIDETGRMRHILGTAAIDVAIQPVDLISRRFGHIPSGLPGAPLREEQIGPEVAVIIQHGHSAASLFKDPGPRSRGIVAVVVDEIDRVRQLLKLNPRGQFG